MSIVASLFKSVCFFFFLPEQEAPDVVCAALGLCQTEQAALAKLRASEQLMSNEIPQVDLAQPVAPFILNVPQLLYPQDTKQEAPKQETPKTVRGAFRTGRQLPALNLALIGPRLSSVSREATTCARTASSS